jgi:hypothetical protein
VPTTINIIVTCTKQKTCEPPSSLLLRNVTGASVESRVRQWKHRLDRSVGNSISPRSLYAGDHWTVAKNLGEFAKPSEQILVWVISAGYGLLPLDALIQPYSATFSTRHPDTVVLPREATKVDPPADKRAWWNALIKLDWDREKPISIADLSAEYPDSPLLIAASANYLHAVQDDLRTARDLMDDKNLLAIMSAGTESLGNLTEHLIPSDARLQPLVGGVLRSLNVRLLRHALETARRNPPTLATISRRFKTLLDEAPERPKYDRTPMSDDEVRSFLKKAIRKSGTATQTGLLRELRDSGKACEQGRFRTLFKEVQGAQHG